MSIYQAIANPMVPDIAQATMQGQQTRLQQEQAAQSREQWELQAQLMEQQIQQNQRALDAPEQTDFTEILSQERARAELGANTIAAIQALPEERRAEAWQSTAAPLLAQLYPDQEISPEYNPDEIGAMMASYSSYLPALGEMEEANREAQRLEALGRPEDARAVRDAAWTKTQQAQSPQRAEMLQSPDGRRQVAPSTQAEYTRLTGQGWLPVTPVQRTQDVGGAAGSEEFIKQLAGRDAERVSDILARGEAAVQKRAELEQISVALESGRFQTGSLGDTRQMLSQFAELIGMEPESIGLGLGDPATADVIDSASRQIGVRLAQDMGRITNMSLRFIEASLPNLARTPAGNRILIELLDRTAQREQAVAALTDDYIAQHQAIRGVPGVPSLQTLINEMDESDPIVTPEMRRMIENASRVNAGIQPGLISDYARSDLRSGRIYRNAAGEYIKYLGNGQGMRVDERGNPIE